MSNEYTAAREALARADTEVESVCWRIECPYCYYFIDIGGDSYINDARENGIWHEEPCERMISADIVKSRAYSQSFKIAPRVDVSKEHLRWALDEIDRLTRGER